MSFPSAQHFSARSVAPDLPPVEAYLPLLAEMHASGWFTNFGPLHERFAARLHEEFGHPGEAVTPCASATAGLSAALIVAARGPHALLPAFTFPATCGAVYAAGLEPIAMDVCPHDWHVRPAALDAALAATGAGAVLLVAPFGIQTNFDEQVAVCRRHGAAVIMDCAAGLGVARANPCLSPDLFEVYSLHATKPLGIGEGGAIFSHVSRAHQLRAALNFALTTNQTPAGPHWGFNGKLSELHAAVGLAQLDRYPERIAGRQRFAAEYVDRLGDLPQLAIRTEIASCPWQFFPMKMPSRRAAEALVARAAEAGIELRRYYRPSLSNWHDMPAVGPCHVSEDLADRMVALPVRPVDHAAEAGAIVEPIVAILLALLSEEKARVV